MAEVPCHRLLRQLFFQCVTAIVFFLKADLIEEIDGNVGTMGYMDKHLMVALRDRIVDDPAQQPFANVHPAPLWRDTQINQIGNTYSAFFFFAGAHLLVDLRSTTLAHLLVELCCGALGVALLGRRQRKTADARRGQPFCLPIDLIVAIVHLAALDNAELGQRRDLFQWLIQGAP